MRHRSVVTGDVVWNYPVPGCREAATPGFDGPAPNARFLTEGMTAPTVSQEHRRHSLATESHCCNSARIDTPQTSAVNEPVWSIRSR
jgi:hypothetical protein